MRASFFQAGLEPVALTYRTLVRLFARDARTRPLALALYTEMRGAQILPDRVTFMALLRALVEERDVENAVSIFADCQAMAGRARYQQNPFFALLCCYRPRMCFFKAVIAGASDHGNFCNGMVRRMFGEAQH